MGFGNNMSVPLLTRAGRGWLACVAMVCLYFVVRLPRLRAFPVFSDEATYLRWAQLVRQDPRHNLFVSMQDAKLPLHYWLLALTRWLAADPVTAGRLLSVLFGALTVVIVFSFSSELVALSGRGVNSPGDLGGDSGGGRRDALFGRFLAPVTAAFLIFSPLIAFLQRMVLAESLLLLETFLVAWLSLRLARLITRGASGLA